MSREPLIMSGMTPWRNLTFGLQNCDSENERVLQIMNQLEMEKTMDLVRESLH